MSYMRNGTAVALYAPGIKAQNALFDAPYDKNAKVHVAFKHLKLRDDVDKPSLKV